MLIRIIASYNISYLTFVYNNKQMTNNKYSKALLRRKQYLQEDLRTVTQKNYTKKLHIRSKAQHTRNDQLRYAREH